MARGGVREADGGVMSSSNDAPDPSVAVWRRHLSTAWGGM